jgi:hypothetical protein
MDISPKWLPEVHLLGGAKFEHEERCVSARQGSSKLVETWQNARDLYRYQLDDMEKIWKNNG